jgi:hypothetical protein
MADRPGQVLTEQIPGFKLMHMARGEILAIGGAFLAHILLIFQA